MDSDYDSQLGRYLNGLIPDRPAELQAMEAYARERDFPIIGPVSGHFCYLIARIIGARRIFEMGSGYGYSTAWFARALKENGGGEIYHVVWDEGLSRMARRHLDALGNGDIVRYRVSEAVGVLRQTPGPFDLIFNDIDKESYPESLSLIEEKLRPGGVLIIDNMIWSGRVFDEKDQTPSTRAIREFTRLINSSDGWISSLVPVGDGLIVAFRK
jgi:predicted O-methyltransferase YrrM